MATVRRIPRSIPQTAAPAQLEQVLETPPQAAPRRAIRRFAGGISTKPDSRSAARQSIAASLQLIATNNTEIDRLVADNDIAVASVTQLMKSQGLTHEEAHGYVAEYAEAFTRAARSVNVPRYKAKVKPADFEASIEIPVTKAAQFLGEKELNEVCDHTAAKSNGFTVKIKKADAKVTRKKG